MSANVMEWCWDWYRARLRGPVTDPTGPPTGTYRGIRGAGSDAEDCRSARRNFTSPHLRL